MKKFMILACIVGALQAAMFQSVEPDKSTLIMQGNAKEYCPNCGMDLAKFYKTNHTHNGKQYCSMHCLHEATKGTMPKDVMVVDTKNLNFIDASKAYYVVGSRMKGTMTQNSKYSFLTEDDAKEFQARNGGEIMSFEKAYEVAGKDFVSDMKMIKAKRDGGVYAKGKEIYETKCTKVDKNIYESIALLKDDLKKFCQISADGDLQAAALYIWDEPKNVNVVKKAEKIVVPKDARCPICGMFVAKNPQWAAMIEADSEKFYFDGVKDMMKYYFKNNKNFNKLFVSDYYKLHKIDAKNAYFVVGSNVFGPMGDELIPFASQNEAINFAKDHAGKQILKFEDITEEMLKGL
ncbi:nitrous oxide reductase accessory protein NosL [Campylobacter californiensis]|uniref:nitrous oxide reductase accessory protein NosL n=1 Tax=Campylobacter californiensis TaxID=1032243 RepID=UPI001D146E49|nr:nitrous oxide reductase accessory protein NosL [Campylobacter sp. RM12916]